MNSGFFIHKINRTLILSGLIYRSSLNTLPIQFLRCVQSHALNFNRDHSMHLIGLVLNRNKKILQ